MELPLRFFTISYSNVLNLTFIHSFTHSGISIYVADNLNIFVGLNLVGLLAWQSVHWLINCTRDTPII